MVTIHEDHSVTFNEEFEAFAQVSRFVHRGAVRIGSTDASAQGVVNSAFENPDGQIALIMRNSESAPLSVQVDDRGHGFSTQVLLPAAGAASLVWK
jgi:glucosylceramidase